MQLLMTMVLPYGMYTTWIAVRVHEQGLHAHIQWQVDWNPKQGPTFDAATIITATQNAEVYKLISGELEALQHLVIVILLNGQLGRLCSTQMTDETRCGKCQRIHVLCSYCIHLQLSII